MPRKKTTGPTPKKAPAKKVTVKKAPTKKSPPKKVDPKTKTSTKEEVEAPASDATPQESVSPPAKVPSEEVKPLAYSDLSESERHAALNWFSGHGFDIKSEQGRDNLAGIVKKVREGEMVLAVKDASLNVSLEFGGEYSREALRNFNSNKGKCCGCLNLCLEGV